VFEIKYLFLFSLQLWSKIFISGRIQRDIITDVLTSSCTVPDILFNFNNTWIFSIDFNHTSEYKTAQKSLQREPSCSTWKDTQSDRQKGRHDVAT